MNDNNKPLLIIAWGFSIGFGLIGLGFLLKWTLPALGAMVGIATAISSGEVVTTNLNPWVIPLAAGGLAVAGGSGGIILLAKVVKEAEKNLYEWTLPILAIIAGFVIDTCQEFYQVGTTNNDSVVRIIYGASVTGLFLLGGILWKQKKVHFKWIDSKMISVIVFMIPPFLIYFKYCEYSRISLWMGYQNIPPHILGAISILLIFSLLIGFLSWVFKDDQ